MTATNWSELGYRQAKGGRLRVRLLWNQRSYDLALEVNDRGLELGLAAGVSCVAGNALVRPFAYMR
jgi:hypothetical protein